ncbi:uncharacterized protein PpBr36_06095 [Pyricularia pennisetigena]|uniref:uncharacterized protein n=1 Tax=Pyricularia pennisetigena TaxID=1578925 RepID=UPI00114DE181|nr:uncharacterized protein PpBr36_06095 [Pyricularia pennisetigena]TLS23707.1 hypothetical protein PpBr36_06095 [Pyricularia pennisetigena]
MSTSRWLDSQVSTTRSPENSHNLIAISNQLDITASHADRISLNSNFVAKQPTTEQNHFDKSTLLHMNASEIPDSGQSVPRHAVLLAAPEEEAAGLIWSVPPASTKYGLRRHQPDVPLRDTEHSSLAVPHQGFQVCPGNPEYVGTQEPPSRQPKDSDNGIVFRTTTPTIECRPVASIGRRRVAVASHNSTMAHSREDYNFEPMAENALGNIYQTVNDVSESPNEAMVYGFRNRRSDKPTRYRVPGIGSDGVAASSRPSSARNSSGPAVNCISNPDNGRGLGPSSFALQPSDHTVQGKRKRDRPQRPTREYFGVIDSQGTPPRRSDYASSVVRHNETHILSRSRPLANRSEHRVSSPGSSSTLSETNRDAKCILEKLNQKHTRIYEEERLHRERLEALNAELHQKYASQEEQIRGQEARLTELLQSAAAGDLEKKRLAQDVNSEKAERIDQGRKVVELRRLLEEEQHKTKELSEQIKAQDKTITDLQNNYLGFEAKKAKLREKAARIKETVNEAIREQQELHQRNKIRLEEVLCEVRQEAHDIKANFGLALTKIDHVQKRALNAARAVRQESAVALAERDLTVKHLTDQLLEKDECLIREQDTIRKLLDNPGKTDARLQAIETNLDTRFSEFLELYEQDKRRLAKDSEHQGHLESKLSHEIGTTIPNQLSHIEAHLELLQTQHSAREDALVIELKECKQGNSVLATTIEEKHNECDRLEAEVYKLQNDLDAKTCENAALQEKVHDGEKHLTCMAEKLTESEQRLSDTIKIHASETEQCLGRLAASEASSKNNDQRVSILMADLEKARNDATQAGKTLNMAQAAWKEQSIAADQRRCELEAQVSENENVIRELQAKLNVLKAQQEQELVKDHERLAASEARNEQDAAAMKSLNAQLKQKEQAVRDAEDHSNVLANELSDLRKRAAELDQLLVRKVDDLASMQASLDGCTAELQSSEARHQCAVATIAGLESNVNELKTAQQSLGAAGELQAEWHKWVSALCERLKEWVVLKSPTASKIYHELLKHHGLAGDMQEFGELASVFLAIYQYLKQQITPDASEVSKLALILKNAEAKRVKLNSPLELPSAVLVSVQEERNIRRCSVRPVPILRQTQPNMPSTPQAEREQQAGRFTNPQANSFRRRSSFQSNTDKLGFDNVTPDATRERNESNTAVPPAASRNVQPQSQQKSPNKMVTRSRRRLFADHQSQP